MKTLLRALLLALALAPSACQTLETRRPASNAAAIDQNSSDLYFKVVSENIEEHSLRVGATAAHLYMDTISEPYLFFAFPAGNSGVGLWFKTARPQTAKLTALSQPRLAPRNGVMSAIEVEIGTGVASLGLADSVLGSMRFIRDRELGIKAPKEVRTEDIQLKGQTLLLARRSLSGLVDYEVKIEPLGDTRIVSGADGFRFEAKSDVRLKITAFSGEPLVTPMRSSDVFKPEILPKIDPDALRAFSFLLYKEKLVAGSPRYFSKFGRDSLYTLKVLMGAFKPAAIEDLLLATLSSSDADTGRISHEQSEGDFVSFERMKKKQEYAGIHAVSEDYKMRDGEFAFATVMAEYLLQFPERAGDFLNRKDQRGHLARDLVRASFAFVEKATTAFAKKPHYKNLIRLYEKETVGNWRDSENGLGGGVYPFDVNSALVPGALKALSDLYASHTTEFFNEENASRLRRSFDVWNSRAEPLFRVRVPRSRAAAQAAAYLKKLGIGTPLSEPKSAIEFPAVSLTTDGKPVAIMHSDNSLVMTYGYPTIEALGSAAGRIHEEFPLGLRTKAGILVANPVFVSEKMQDKFTERKYHGRVSWGMQEDLLLAGLERQLKRTDLPRSLRESLERAKSEVVSVARAKESMKGTEVFSILYRDGDYVAIPFAGDAKSNSNQLWSHLRMASPRGQ